MGSIEALLILLGLKKAVLAAGFIGGGISGGIMAGPLAALSSLRLRVLVGALCGTAIAGFGAQPLADALERPGSLSGIALGLGLFGLSFVFKLLKAWNDFDLSGVLGRLIDKLLGGVFK